MIERIIQTFSENDIEICEEKAQMLLYFYEELIDYNDKVNLTAITGFDEVLIKHFLDSAIISRFFPEIISKKIIDVGTGAGFPGLVLGIIYENTTITLLETLNKRCTFLNKMVNDLKLTNINVVNERAEILGKDLKYRETFDYAVSRAVAKLNVLGEYLIPFVRVGGNIVSYKGSILDEEIIEANNSFKLLGCSQIKTKKFMLPYVNDNRAFVYSKKEKPSPDKYPRRAGVPSKNPII